MAKTTTIPVRLEPAPVSATAPATMRAHVLVEPGRLEMREIETPEPEPDGVVVQVRAALTCGTDLKAFLRGHPKFPTPTLFGHEFSGVIARVGRNVTAFREGDAIMSTHSAPCGECYFCKRGQENLCETIMSTMVLGAYAEYIHIPGRIVRQNMYLKPASLSFREAALLEPLSCVVYGLEDVPLRPDDTALIIGNGAIGLLLMLTLKARGVENVIVAGRRPFRQRAALALGATHVINVAEESPEERIREITNGRGADLVIECTGQPAVWEQSVSLVRRGGNVVLFGGCKRGTTVTFDTMRLHYDQITVRSPFHMTPGSVRKAYELLTDGRINGERLITSDYPLDRLNEVFDLLQRGDCIKFAVIP